MKKIFLLCLFYALVTVAHAQKKLIPVPKSALTGIGLPNGSKQDSRILSVAAAATLLEMESNKTNTKIQNTEVLVLAPASVNKFNKDSLIQRLTARSWKITPTEDNNYLWLQKDMRVVIAYFDISTKQTDLYFAEAILPVTPAKGTNTISNQTPKQIIVQPVNQVNEPQNSQLNSQTISNDLPIIGSWGKSNSVGQVNNRFGTYSYVKYQYTFNSNGTYSFTGKNYSEQYDETLLIKESGTYLINENKLAINPQKSVIEAWSKKNGGDNWNQLKTSQQRALEKATYQIAIVDRNLVLQTDSETERDGRFSSANLYSYGPPGTFTAIQLPGSDGQQNTEHPTAAFNTGFKFTSTNFDDGWVSTVEEDWVEVSKGNIKVLLHYPKEGTIFPADPEPLTNAAWNILVAPRYSNLKNYKTSYVEDYKRPYFGMGYAKEIKTGKSVFVVLFRRASEWIEVMIPDNNSFTQEFGFNPESIRWGSISEYMGGWVLDNSQGKTVKADPEVFDRLEKMATYNKFAVAASDFTGRWTNDFTGIQQMYHVYSGQYAGMNINQSNEEFDFKAGNTYNWKLLVVNGMAGTVKANQVKSSGTFSVPNNWQIQFSDIEGKPKIYNAFFSCMKGARLLNLLDAQYPGSGIYTQYGMAK